MIDEKTKETIKSALGKIDANRATLRNPSFENVKEYEKASRATIDATVDIGIAYLKYQSQCEARGERPMSIDQYMELARKL